MIRQSGNRLAARNHAATLRSAQGQRESDMAAEVTQVLAKFAATLTYEDLPQSVREHCKNLILDALACAVAGHQGEETGQVAAFTTALAQGSESGVIGGDASSLAGAT